MDVPRRVDDPVPAAEQAAISDPLQDLGDFGAIVGVLVAQEQFGRGLDLPGFVAVHAGDLIGPHPPVISDEVLEPTDLLRVAAGQHSGDLPRTGAVCRRIRRAAESVRHRSPRSRRNWSTTPALSPPEYNLKHTTVAAERPKLSWQRSPGGPESRSRTDRCAGLSTLPTVLALVVSTAGCAMARGTRAVVRVRT